MLPGGFRAHLQGAQHLPDSVVWNRLLGPGVNYVVCSVAVNSSAKAGCALAACSSLPSVRRGEGQGCRLRVPEGGRLQNHLQVKRNGAAVCDSNITVICPSLLLEASSESLWASAKEALVESPGQDGPCRPGCGRVLGPLPTAPLGPHQDTAPFSLGSGRGVLRPDGQGCHNNV